MKWLSIVALAGLLALSIAAGLSFAAEPCGEQVSLISGPPHDVI
jgi:hypothetical protein